ncbi:hypothetical protein EDD86DRAFT_190914 [Gorgonomyces haynaldii]|nr:hypothetical protein EDD86DRAFT_190914 [Gorgonomyces haynaldii]
MLLYWLILQAIEFLQRTTYVFIKNTCSPISACDSKVVQVVISQVGFLVAAFLVTSSFLMLSKLVELNALTLIERERFMQQLYAANLDLKRQLRIYKKDNQGIVEAPLESAINILQELSHAQMEEGLKEQVLFLVDVLSSDKLMQPDLYQNTEDTDVHDWLKDMLLSSEDQPQAREEVEDSLEIIVPKVEWNLQQVDHKLFELLEKSLDADFDIFNLETVTNGHALYYFSLHIFHKFEFGPKLKINAETFTTWISHIESNYRHSNAYHNSTHAADVAQMMLYFVTKPKLMSHLSIEELMSCLIAGIIHDYMHPGVNNAYLVATSNPLALRYNDVAVLENFHSASFFELLAAEKNMDIFASLSNDQRKNCRELIIGMVLATDMTGHFDWIGKFKARMAGTGLNFDNKQDKKLCLNLSIKAADINNATKSRQMCLQWTEMVMEEFFRQGDEEKSRGLPISPFMNRETTDIPKCQIGFIDFIVVPLYEAYAMFMGDELSVQLQNLQANKAYWKMCAEDPSKQVRMPVFTVDRSLHPPGITKSVSRNRSLNRAMTSRSPSEKERRKSREQSIKIPSTLITVTSELDVTTPPLGNTHPNLPSSSSRPNGFSAKLPTIAAESADQLSDHPHHKKLFTHLEPLQSNAPMPNSPTLGSSWRKLDPIRKDDKSP